MPKYTLTLLYKKQGGRCFYCKCACYLGRNSNNGASVDHYIARSTGGGYQLENKVMACRECNSHKGNMTHEEFVILRKIRPDTNKITWVWEKIFDTHGMTEEEHNLLRVLKIKDHSASSQRRMQFLFD
jgi:CRISPR/Cas system Type II protein with McrA/HNH and RuvC-like nuclease domain